VESAGEEPFTPTPEKPIAVTPLATPAATATARPQPSFYVSTDGDDGNDGSAEQPWRTISHAVHEVPDGSVVLVAPGVYDGEVALRRQFSEGIVVRSQVPYQARLEYDHTVVTCYTCAGITLESFEIAHDGEGAARYVIQIQDVEGDGEGGQRVVLRNNIIHDSRNNDLVKVNNGAGNILISGNLFYNQGGPHRDSHLDINSVTNVIVEDNVFFNYFEASERNNDNDTGSFVVIKDSNGDDDANVGSQDIIVRRNIFLNWQGAADNTFLVIGEDSVDYFQAQDVLVENNLMLGNSPNLIQAAFQVRGSRGIVFRHNTIAGDMPAKVYAFRLARAADNPDNEAIYFYNNIWSDPTGTMGTEGEGHHGFSDVDPEDTDSAILANNLYWNGGALVPPDENSLLSIADDERAIMEDPLLGDQEDLVLPLWVDDKGRFADGSVTIREAFERLVRLYGTPNVGSAALDAAEAEYAATEDILGHPRPAGNTPDVGAVELVP
jgi:hypothetical protein